MGVGIKNVYDVLEECWLHLRKAYVWRIGILVLHKGQKN